ncbi:hypothetical protein GC163_15695 [bacterium]|nr:hypothetical protein [bacterium]
MKSLFWLAALASLVASTADAGHRKSHCCAPCAATCAPAPTCAPCGTSCAPAACAPAPAPACEPQMVEKTVWEPMMVTETKKVMVTEYKEEMKDVVSHVKRIVPKTEKKSREVNWTEWQETTEDVQVTVKKPVMKTVDVTYTVLVPEQITKTGKKTICKPTWEEVEKEYTVMVPMTETKQGVRKVMQCVPVVKKTTVCEDKGQWVQQAVETPACAPCAPACGGCSACAPAIACGCASPCNSACGTTCAPATKMVWVPNVVQREVEVTVQEMQCVDQPYEYQVTTCVPEVKKCMVKVCKMTTEEVDYSWTETVCKEEVKTCQKQVCDWEDVVETRQVKKCVAVPKSKMEEYECTTYECVTEEVKSQVKVCTPVCVEKEIEVQVCKMVEKKIMVPAPTCCAAPACSTCAPTPSCCK